MSSEAGLIILISVLALQIIPFFFKRRTGLFGISPISMFRKSDSLKININIIGKPGLLKYIFIISVFIVFGLIFYQSYQQYRIWSQNEISKFLLPPYQSPNYFIFYCFTRFFASYLISLLAAFLFFFAAKGFNKKYEKRFFEPEELWLGTLALFLTGWPGALFYFVGLILIYFIIHASYSLIYNSSSRLSLYYLWIPLAIFVIIISKWLRDLPLWNLLKM